MRKILIFWCLLAGIALADPCGMVPPISLPDTDGPAIERVGEQRTYVFYKEGIETVVIHPGFKGQVDQFGMLIPFPNPPALRKMPDQIFDHLENAANPPLVTFHRYLPRPGAMYKSRAADDGLRLQQAAPESVRVISEEAVGMYEVAVLEAGSAAALKRWMDDRGYRYPEGMDKTCNDYVADGWCFVAVKTRVGRKAGVDPRPGMRKVDPQKPPGSTFEGKVQAMGFRFPSKEFVVPMRLSAFNAGELKNKVYVLAEEPVRVKNLPVEFVQEQIDGASLYRNVTQPLPYKLVGVTDEQLTEAERSRLAVMRDPKPKNGQAAVLFASDLMALQQDDLILSFERTEKQLLDIGERLNLRGGRLDQWHHAVLQDEKEKALANALSGLQGMTLTLIEGDFPREVLARENLYFVPYTLATEPARESPKLAGLWLALPVLLMAWRRRTGFLCTVVLAAVFCGGTLVHADQNWRTVRGWIDLLDDPDQSAEAREQILKRPHQAPEWLLRHAENSRAPLVERGYCLALLPDLKADDTTEERLRKVYKNSSEPQLVRLWAAAAALNVAGTPEAVERVLDETQGMNELGRPAAMKLQDFGSQLRLPLALKMLGKYQHLRNEGLTVSRVAMDRALAGGTDELVKVMLEAPENETRRGAAGLLSSMTRDQKKKIFDSLIQHLDTAKGAKKPAWEGGALFLPQMSFDKAEARELIRVLVAWRAWVDANDQLTHAQAIENNLRSYNLWTAAGGGSLNWRGAKGAQQWRALYEKLKP